MKKLIIPLIIIAYPLISNAENRVFEFSKNISEIRKTLIYDLRIILNACKQRQPFSITENIKSTNNVIENCSFSSNFPESTFEKNMCNIINSKKEVKIERIACAKAELPNKFTSQALAPHYLYYKKNHPHCKKSQGCYEEFFNDFSLAHSKEWGCNSRAMLSYNLICKVFSYQT